MNSASATMAVPEREILVAGVTAQCVRTCDCDKEEDNAQRLADVLPERGAAALTRFLQFNGNRICRGPGVRRWAMHSSARRSSAFRRQNAVDFEEEFHSDYFLWKFNVFGKTTQGN